MRLIIPLLLAFFGARAEAADSKSIRLDYSYSYLGKLLCSGSNVVLANGEYLVCEGSESGNRIEVRLKAEPECRQQIKVLARIEKILST